MENIPKEQIGLSRTWKTVQIYSLHFAAGSISVILIWSRKMVEDVFIKAHLETFYNLFFAFFIVLGTVFVFFSGGIGLVRLINAKRILQLMEKEDKKDE